MPDPDVASDHPPRPAAHVVLMTQKSQLGPATASCLTLPDQIVRQIEAAAPTWRDNKYKVRYLRDVLARHGLGGLALVWCFSPFLPPLTPPLDVPFEPLPLDESNATLREILHAVPANPTGTPAPRPSAWRKLFVRLGPLFIAIVVLLAQAIFHTFLHRRNPATVFLWTAVGITFAVALLLNWSLFGEWLIIPGGLVERRFVFGRLGVTLRRFTPAQTLLLIRPSPPGWSVAVWTHRCLARKLLTHYEVAALLAAWQSSLPPPPPEKLEDLR